MKREEKSSISREKILQAAIAEFGKNNYHKASLNNICSQNHISKGLIYHYFKNKDELYLCCVKLCFDELTKFLYRESFLIKDFQSDINRYISLRSEFFHMNQQFGNIFFNSVIQPPDHLKNEIKQLRKVFDEEGVRYYKRALDKITLRDGITEEDAIEFFFIFQEMFNGYFQSIDYENTDFNRLIEAHEMKLSKLLNIMIYGIANNCSDKEELK